NHEGYIRLLTNELLPEIAKEGLADFIDVFCEEGYFSVEETKMILEAGSKYGLRPKVHVNQFNVLGGVKASVDACALSVDHLELISEDDITALLSSDTVPVALPGCSLFLKIPYTPARKIIDAGLPLALATDYNPGSSPSGNMNLVNSLACIQMQMTPEEVLNASTINGAFAMDVQDLAGSITIGKKANLLLTKPIESLASLPYYFGSNLVERNLTA
ncbi:MAG: amidohydrolase family protein, partial [Chitinophagales bacterium]|nr:amidohydrolase family protein [Chitinophagales bacterium]